MPEQDVPAAIPLWFNGHAFLTLAPTFHDVINPQTGNILRRTPLCGPAEAAMMVDSARRAQKHWEVSEHRGQLATMLGDALAAYAEHFSQLVDEETGAESSAADDEIGACVSLLRAENRTGIPEVVGIVGNTSRPLLTSLQLACPVLQAGGTIVFLPNPQAASALFALAELSGQCGFPAGVISVLHGNNRAIDGLQAALGHPLLFA